MKREIVLCFLLGSLLLLSACKATKQLPTDNGRVINISGGWNETDAAIIVSQFKKALLNSAWYEASIERGSNQNAIYIEEVVFHGLQEPFDKSLKGKIVKSLQPIDNLQIYSEDGIKTHSLKLNTTVEATSINSFDESAVKYDLAFQLIDAQGAVLWTLKESTKKYLSE